LSRADEHLSRSVKSFRRHGAILTVVLRAAERGPLPLFGKHSGTPVDVTEGMAMLWLVLGIWVFGSVCFIAGAWWATRPKERDALDQDPPDLAHRHGSGQRMGEPPLQDQTRTKSAPRQQPLGARAEKPSRRGLL